ncbi:hypothetical protein [Roseitranquillus sediminis]|uniref:hypothetical protein n=1 Tax=Roseitranquillus sediminis TaxID=2809051 RepID=UPI001D0C91B4|nr:hypothetical protein [Roseitranquillus sediminis]
MPFWMGLPGAMKCQTAPAASVPAKMMFELNSVPWSLTMRLASTMLAQNPDDLLLT